MCRPSLRFIGEPHFPVVCTKFDLKVKNDHRSIFSNLATGKKKPEKNQGFNEIPVQCSMNELFRIYITSKFNLYTLSFIHTVI